MQRTIASTIQPVYVEAFLRSDPPGVADEPSRRWLDFETGGRMISTRQVMDNEEILVATRLFNQAVHIHLLAMEYGGTIFGIFFVPLPETTPGDPWMPGMENLLGKAGSDQLPHCYILGEVEVDGDCRPDGDFIRDVKAILMAATDTHVTDATERVIDDLLEATTLH